MWEGKRELNKLESCNLKASLSNYKLNSLAVVNAKGGGGWDGLEKFSNENPANWLFECEVMMLTFIDHALGNKFRLIDIIAAIYTF